MGPRRLLIEDNDDAEDNGQGTLMRFFLATKSFGVKTGKFGLKTFYWTIKKGGRVLWITGTTAILVVFPLMMEIDREQSVIEMENLKVKDLQAQGVHDSQIANMGLTVPKEPSVMTQ
mmetsp:Transcript_2586/g.3519  ORF Transcript_2586/g.3519 Transcript_2586/m.3519 type:complete len:117 (+) Transcript_2586:34-384(+)